MKEYLPIIRKSFLFNGLSESEIESILGCLKMVEKKYDKNEFILRSGEPVRSIGMIVEGTAFIIKEDFWGKRTILSELLPGNVFAESYACLAQTPLDISVLANAKTTVIFLDISRIISVCSSACSFHTRLIQNLLTTVSNKNLLLTRKMDYLAKRTIRERLLSYLSTEAIRQGSPQFDITFTRQELADFLSVDRSALSSEISKLQSEGIISCKRNRFRIFLVENKK